MESSKDFYRRHIRNHKEEIEEVRKWQMEVNPLEIPDAVRAIITRGIQVTEHKINTFESRLEELK